MVIKKSVFIGLLCFYTWAKLPNALAQNEFSQDPVVIQMPDLGSYSEEEKAALQKTAELVKQKIAFHMKAKFDLPDTAFDEKDGQIVSFSDLFKHPSSTEVGRLAYDENGNRRALTSEQMDQIRQEGVFVIPSQEYPGQNHVWRLSLLIQKGSKNIQVSFDKDMGTALSHIIIKVPQSLYGEKFSVTNGFSRFYKGIRGTLAAFVGLIEKNPKHSSHDVTRIIEELKENYVAKELMAQKEQYTAGEAQKTDSFAVDLRLYDKKLGEKLAPIVNKINNAFSETWKQSEHKIRMQQKQLIKDSGITKESLLEDQLNKKMVLIKEDTYSKMLLTNKELETQAPGYGQLLVNHQVALRVAEQVEKNLVQVVAMQEEIIADTVRRQYPKLSLSEEWYENKVKELSSEFYRDVRWDHLMTTPLYLESIGLFQEAFVYRKIIDFQKNAEENIRKELEEEKEPSKSFNFQKKIWNSDNWIIKSYQEQDDQNPLVKKLRFYAEEYSETHIDTSIPFWRLAYAANETHANLKNGLYRILVSNLWNGPVGLRSLFGTKAFYPEKTLDAATGKVVTNRNYSHETFKTRLENIWKSVAQSRKDFESAPDTGFLGKRYTRWLHQFWEYAVVGVGGTVAVAVGQPVLTALNLAFSTAATASAPVWAPLSSIFRLTFNATIYDTLSPQTGDSRYLFPVLGYIVSDVAVNGVGQMTLAGINAAAIQPTLAAIHGVYGATRKVLRTAYDALTAKVLIKHGRWPATNSFLADRIAGPGLSSNYFFQIKPEIAVLALQAQLESIELNLYGATTLEEIQKPLKEYKAFMSHLLSGLGVSIMGDNTASHLAKIAANQEKALEQLLTNRKHFLHRLQSTNLGMVRLEKEDLEKALELSEKLTKSFYEEKLLPSIDASLLDKFWASNDCAEGDYKGVATKLLSQVFSEQFLEPLEVTDETFVIHVEDEDLCKRLEKLTSSYK